MSGRAVRHAHGGYGKKGKVERRRAERLARSTEIPSAAAETMILSAAFARERGTRLNRFVTIPFKANLCPDRTLVALGRFLKLAGDWLRMKGVIPAYIWVIENPADADEHVHLLIHVPDDLRSDFARLQRGWIARTGTRVGKGVIHSKDIPDNADAITGLLRYMLKGADAETRKMFGIDHRGSQGVVEGKRCGVAQSIGRKARKRHGGVLGARERPSGGGQNLKKPDIATAPSPDETSE